MKVINKSIATSILTLVSASVFAQPIIDLYKSPTCGCCVKWGELMKAEGYTVNYHHTEDWSSLKKDVGMPMQLQSCHTAVIDGYLIEGHVPEQDVARLILEKPENVSGLAVPRMPRYSPGMAEKGQQYKDFNVIQFSQQGTMTVYQQY
ncbi:hypothetical protein DFP77_1412 [Marinomonas foliarum]|jgi:hypothetical protein|uniref:Uncharacterized conserved protein n=3 Tax=Marinomonas TaxID=28253 RepID=A0A1M4VY49_9GAMM|nr:hypothetical protein DFP77_1412 [Marinomonas foliarum]SHE73869.1 Uncharacterized conserved protein [Marinomonas polaris DSM 16579]